MKNRISCLALIWLLVSAVGYGQNTRSIDIMPIEFKPSDLVLLLARERANSGIRPGLNFDLKTPTLINEAISLTINTGDDPRVAALIDQFVRDLDDVINNRPPQARSNGLIPSAAGQGNGVNSTFGTPSQSTFGTPSQSTFGTPSQFDNGRQTGSGGNGSVLHQDNRQPDASQNWGSRFNDSNNSVFSGGGQTQNPGGNVPTDFNRRTELNTPTQPAPQPTGMPLRDGVNPSGQPTSVIDQRGFPGQQPSMPDQNWQQLQPLQQSQPQQQPFQQQPQQQPFQQQPQQQSQPGFAPINTSGQQMVQAPLLRQPDPLVPPPTYINPYAAQPQSSAWSQMYPGYPQTPATFPQQTGMYTSTWHAQPSQNQLIPSPEAIDSMIEARLNELVNSQRNNRPGIAGGEPNIGGPLTAEIPGQKATALTQQESLAENARRQILFLFFLLLFSVALNVYLGVIARGFYSRYQDLADELRETFTTTA